MKYKIKEDVLWKIVDSEAVMVDSGKKEYCFLNPTGTEIWRLINKEKSTTSMKKHILKKYDAIEREIKKDIESLIKELLEKNLIEEIKDE